MLGKGSSCITLDLIKNRHSGQTERDPESSPAIGGIQAILICRFRGTDRARNFCKKRIRISNRPDRRSGRIYPGFLRGDACGVFSKHLWNGCGPLDYFPSQRNLRHPSGLVQGGKGLILILPSPPKSAWVR